MKRAKGEIIVTDEDIQNFNLDGYIHMFEAHQNEEWFKYIASICPDECHKDICVPYKHRLATANRKVDASFNTNVRAEFIIDMIHQFHIVFASHHHFDRNDDGNTLREALLASGPSRLRRYNPFGELPAISSSKTIHDIAPSFIWQASQYMIRNNDKNIQDALFGVYEAIMDEEFETDTLEMDFEGYSSHSIEESQLAIGWIIKKKYPSVFRIAVDGFAFAVKSLKRMSYSLHISVL